MLSEGADPDIPEHIDDRLVVLSAASNGGDSQGSAPSANEIDQVEPPVISDGTGNSDQTEAADKKSLSPEVKESEDFRASQFANKHELSWWFPQIEDDEKRSWRIWLSKRSRSLLINTTVVGSILLANFVLTIIATSRYTSQNGVGIIYEGDCDTVKRLSLWLHLLINLLGTGMLSASNYCMQLQAAPTRENVNRAHKDGRWLDIGVSSMRNLWYIGNWRRFSWILLAISSVPVHLIYNSAVFASLGSSDYTVAVVNDAFLTGGNWSLTAAQSRVQEAAGWLWEVNPTYLNNSEIIHNMQQTVLQYESAISELDRNTSYSNSTIQTYTAMNVSACFDYYNDYWAEQGNVIILVQNTSVQAQDNDTLLAYVSIIPRFDDWPKNLWALENGTDIFLGGLPSDPVNTWFLSPAYYSVSHCLVQQPASSTIQCRFEYSPQIMITICILNFSKTAIMITIWAMRKWQSDKQKDPQKVVLYTLGDAVASFMRDPDETTRDMCLATSDDFRTKRRLKNKFVKEDANPPREPREWQYTPRFWMKAASVRRWIVLIFFCLLVLILAAYLLGVSFVSLRHRNVDTSIAGLWSLGFGALTPYTYVVLPLPRADPAGLIANVIVANLPQLIFSILYIVYNSMLSCFLVQREFSRMYCTRKPLRVSEPEGIQRSSYFISLPLRYGVPLYIVSGVMHWLISQSLFLARITAYLPDGKVDQNSTFSTCGYSPIAIFITILVGFTLVLSIIIMGLRKYDGTMPLVSTNSHAISAACHVLAEDIPDGYLLPVQWGVVQIKEGVGHAAFTTAHIMKNLEANKKYA